MGPIRRTAGVWGPAAFAGAAVVAARHQPGYSHRTHHVSGLAASGERSAWAMIPGFLALGAASLVMPAPGRAVTRFSRLAGVTTLAAGLVRVSEPRCPQPGRDASATRADLGHAVASVVTFACWTAMPIVARSGPGPGWYRRTSAVLAGATAVGFVAAGISTHVDSPSKGLVQRLMLGSVFAWFVATSAAAHARGAGPSLGGPA